LPSFPAETWIKNKSLPDTEALLDGYIIAYEDGWEKMTLTCSKISFGSFSR